MNLGGLSDFSRNLIDASVQCRCGSVARVRSGLCIGCLLREGLGPDELDGGDFEALLANTDVPDRDWRLGNYQILEEIGRGGMGVIYRARHRASRRIVGLKCVLSYYCDSPQTLARFQCEVEAAASLDHPNIVPIYDVGTTDDGLPYFSMKFAAGGSLLDARGQFRNAPPRSAKLIAKVARAIDYAHNHGVLHRDLKPGNILLDGGGEPMVSDFGLAKWLGGGGDLTRTLTVFGTPGYIAPEQAQEPKVSLTAAVDVYSLGAILFELLSARPPFLGEHAISILRQAAEKRAPKLRSIAPELDRDLETICARCLEQEPKARYRSAGDLAEDIERWLEDRPITARQLSLPARLWRWARRNRALAASLFGCLVLGTAAASWQVISWRLKNAVRTEILASHRVAILPFLDLDDATFDSNLTGIVAGALQARMATIGPGMIIRLEKPFANWTGTGTSTEVRLAGQKTNCRAVLVGMFRRLGGRTRLSLHLIGENGTDNLQNWTLEIPKLESAKAALIARDVGRSIYTALDGKAAGGERSLDPAMVDATARRYLNAGRALLDRRTIPDMDRTITCFENAVRAAPKSVLARSYLAQAYMGRNFLAADPVYIERAYRVTKEALEISPEDPSAHRALCALDTFTGHFDEALDHGLRALELGDSTERALGQIAYIWEELGRPDKAIRWFGKARMNETQAADYEALVGDAWMLLTEDDKAREAYNASSNFRPDLPEGWLGLCHLKLLHSDFEQARALFNARAAEYSAFHTTKPLQAQIEFFARNFPEAERLYDEILRADPRGVGAQQYGAISTMSALARLKMINSHPQEAGQLIKQCIASDQTELEKSPRHPEVLYRLAADEAIRGNAALSLTYLRTSIGAGYIDYRSTRLDPRFDAVAATPAFQQILSELAAHVAALGRPSPAVSANGE